MHSQQSTPRTPAQAHCSTPYALTARNDPAVPVQHTHIQPQALTAASLERHNQSQAPPSQDYRTEHINGGRRYAGMHEFMIQQNQQLTEQLSTLNAKVAAGQDYTRRLEEQLHNQQLQAPQSRRLNRSDSGHSTHADRKSPTSQKSVLAYNARN